MWGITDADTAKDMSDEAILARSQAEPWLFALLLDRYQDAFVRKARTILRDARDVEEIVQDAFTKIYLNAARFTPQEGASFSSWAYKILINTALTRYRKLQREGARVAPLDPEYEPHLAALDAHGHTRDDTDMIERVLARLPGHFAHVLRLHYLERYSHADIAQETGESVGAVKTRVHRAKAAFRKEVRPGELDSITNL